jgi:hypothetical protein
MAKHGNNKETICWKEVFFTKTAQVYFMIDGKER